MQTELRQAAFETGWWSFDLGRYRPCEGTYQLYPRESLPALDERLFRGDYAWLAPRSEQPNIDLSAIEDEARARKVPLPKPFVTFMGDKRLQDAVPSCTACEWDLGKRLVPCRVVEGAYTLRFLRDQQDCLFWYLHLAPGKLPTVICSPLSFDDPSLVLTREQALANTWQVAPHFEHFVYRFWMENELWGLLEQRAPELSEPQQRYLAHYERTAEA